MSEEEAERVATVRAEYCASLESRLATYDRASSVDCKWSTVKSAVVDAAEAGGWSGQAADARLVP